MGGSGRYWASLSGLPWCRDLGLSELLLLLNRGKQAQMNSLRECSAVLPLIFFCLANLVEEQEQELTTTSFQNGRVSAGNTGTDY